MDQNKYPKKNHKEKKLWSGDIIDKSCGAAISLEKL
jgi:hypothetical protein